MWFIYTMEYYLGMKKNEVWPFVATWMELESVMLSEISQAEKDTICFHSYVDPEKFNKDHGGGEAGKKKVTEREGGKP